MSLLALAPLVFAQAAAPTPAAAPLDAPALAERLAVYLDRLEPLGFSGAFLVAREGEVLCARSYGLANRAAGVPVTSDTVFPLGSITKHFTAAAILRLEMDGLLSVEDPLELYFDDLPPGRNAITIHQLLCHTSGLPEAAGNVAEATGPEDFVRRCLRNELAFPPGRGRGYSNLGYGVLAALVELLSDQPYEAYLREALFLPAGMERTGSHLPEWGPDALAHGYIDGRDAGTLLDGRRIDWGIRGAGGLMSTAHDMLRWDRALDEETVLDAAAIEKMTTVHSGRDGRGMGYGCGIRPTPAGTRRIGHDGSNDVFSAEFSRYPDDGLYVFAAGTNADVYAFDVTPRIERMLFGQEVPLPPAVVALAPEELALHAGVWELADGGGSIEVRVLDGALTLASADPRAAALLHPVRADQVARREGLLASVEAGFRSALEGDLAPLHRLLDPYAPADEFAERLAGLLDAWLEALGEALEVRAVPGRNRFGEVAVVAEVRFEGGVRRIEYSFGPDEVGSIRLLDAFPARVVLPLGDGAFGAYDAEADLTWKVEFLPDERGRPAVLLLRDEGGRAHEAARSG